MAIIYYQVQLTAHALLCLHDPDLRGCLHDRSRQLSHVLHALCVSVQTGAACVTLGSCLMCAWMVLWLGRRSARRQGLHL
jgi:hypothetical protein